jgi:hypothetical protein
VWTWVTAGWEYVVFEFACCLSCITNVFVIRAWDCSLRCLLEGRDWFDGTTGLLFSL